MEVPDTPLAPEDDESLDGKRACLTDANTAQTRAVKTQEVYSRGTKRRRITAPGDSDGFVTDIKNLTSRESSPHTEFLKSTVSTVDEVTNHPETALEVPDSESLSTPGQRPAKIREVLHLIINESLRVGGRPESAFAKENEGGETIEVQTRDADGGLSTKTIDWSVEPDVPEAILIDEKDLAKRASQMLSERSEIAY